MRRQRFSLHERPSTRRLAQIPGLNFLTASPAILKAHLGELLGDRERLQTMSRSMIAAARPDAAGHIYSELVGLVGARRR